MKKIILTAFTATCLLLPSSPIFAGPLTISLGIPQEHTFTEKNESGSKIETDGSSGYFLGIKFPIGFGLGIDSYKTKFKGDTSKIVTIMYNNLISVSYSSDKPYNWIRFWQNERLIVVPAQKITRTLKVAIKLVIRLEKQASGIQVLEFSFPN